MMQIALLVLLVVFLLWLLGGGSSQLTNALGQIAGPPRINPAKPVGTNIPYSGTPGGGANLASLLKSAITALTPAKATTPPQSSQQKGGGSGASGGGAGSPSVGPSAKPSPIPTAATGNYYQDPSSGQWYDPQGNAITVVTPNWAPGMSATPAPDNTPAPPPIPAAVLGNNAPLDSSTGGTLGTNVNIQDIVSAPVSSVTSAPIGVADNPTAPDITQSAAVATVVGAPIPVPTLDTGTGIGASATGDNTGTLDYTTPSSPADGGTDPNLPPVPDTSQPVGIDTAALPVDPMWDTGGGGGGGGDNIGVDSLEVV